VGNIELKAAWSGSAIKTLRGCQRQYYIEKLLSWEGWLNDAPQLKRLAYTLKNGTNLPMWAGSIVHDVCQESLESLRDTGDLIPRSEMKDKCTQLLRKGWIQSTNKQWQGSPKWNVNLMEHYYDEGIMADKLEMYKNKVMSCVDGFHDSDLIPILKSLKPEDFLEIESLELCQLKTGEEFYIKIDLAFKYDGKVWLVDWKTGKVSVSVLEQLSVYGIYAKIKGWINHPSELVLVPAYLACVKEQGSTATPRLEIKLEQMKLQAKIIQQEYPLLQEALKNKDNKEWFTKTTDERMCERCKYRDKQLCSGAATEIGEGVTPF